MSKENKDMPKEFQQWITENSEKPMGGNYAWHRGAIAAYRHLSGKAAIETEIRRSAIDRLYQSILACGEPFPGELREVFHKAMNSLPTGPSSKPEIGPRWVKASNQKPADGVDGQILHIKPVKIRRSHADQIYAALIYMGKHDGGLAWHWYEGPRSGWHTKIALEDWDKIEYLDESIPSSEPGFGISDNDLQKILDRCLKPEEIGGDPEIQHNRMAELMNWFARYAKNEHANPKWMVGHAMELAYYIASNSGNRFIDLEPIRLKAYKEGAMITHGERSLLERMGTISPMPSPPPSSEPAKESQPHPEDVKVVEKVIREIILKHINTLDEQAMISEIAEWMTSFWSAMDEGTEQWKAHYENLKATIANIRPWPLGAYAPGNYFCKCHICKKQFRGDKRAVVCLECAMSATQQYIGELQAKAAQPEPSEEKRPDDIPDDFFKEALTCIMLGGYGDRFMHGAIWAHRHYVNPSLPSVKPERERWKYSDFIDDKISTEKEYLPPTSPVADVQQEDEEVPEDRQETKRGDLVSYYKWIKTVIEDENDERDDESLAYRLAYEFQAHVDAVYEGSEDLQAQVASLQSQLSAFRNEFDERLKLQIQLEAQLATIREEKEDYRTALECIKQKAGYASFFMDISSEVLDKYPPQTATK